ncbi:MAG: hypothetical protein J0I11_15120 [Actinobacteria bacterium]|nr:hypothetical protein [Actinomycetota bacterium]
MRLIEFTVLSQHISAGQQELVTGAWRRPVAAPGQDSSYLGRRRVGRQHPSSSERQ